MSYLVIKEVVPSAYKAETTDRERSQRICDGTIVEFRCASFSVFYEQDKNGNWNASYSH